MIDWSRLAELRAEIGESDCAEVFGLFFDEIETATERLRRPAALAALQADLHAIRGAALNLGFVSLGRLAAGAEASAAAGSVEESQLEAVVDAYRTSRALFEARAGAA